MTEGVKVTSQHITSTRSKDNGNPSYCFNLGYRGLVVTLGGCMNRYFRIFSKTEFVTFTTVEEVDEQTYLDLPKQEQCCFSTVCADGNISINFDVPVTPKLLTLIGLAWM